MQACALLKLPLISPDPVVPLKCASQKITWADYNIPLNFRLWHALYVSQHVKILPTPFENSLQVLTVELKRHKLLKSGCK